MRQCARQNHNSGSQRWRAACWLQALALASLCGQHVALAQSRPHAKVVLILIDGLRPDQINEERMPHLAALAGRSVVFQNHHSIFPTVTRVNASTIATGTYPETHGILSNLLYMPAVSPAPLTTGESSNLITREGLHGDHILARGTLSEAMTAAGEHFVAITSGSSGAATLLAPEARHGVGTLINAGLENGKRVAYPDAVDKAIRSQFETQAAHEGLSSVLWAQRVVREYILPKLPSDLLIDWMTEPDSSQHAHGVGSPEALHALRAVDEEVGKLMQALQDRNELTNTDIIITADHGFGDISSLVPLRDVYKTAEVPENDVTALNDGPTSSFYLHPADASAYAKELQQLTETLERREDVQLLFTRSLQGKRCKQGATTGSIAGTFALEHVHLCAADGPDLVVTMRPTGVTNKFGEEGSVPVLTVAATESAATHGGLNPWMEHIPLICTGPDFQGSRTFVEPTGNIDLTATLARILGVTMTDLQGRDLTSDWKLGKAGAVGMHRQYRATAYGIHRFLNTTTYLGEEYVDDGEATITR